MLKDGKVIQCDFEGISDKIDNKSIALYFLDEFVIEDLKKTSIDRIRFEILPHKSTDFDGTRRADNLIYKTHEEIKKLFK